MPSRPPREEERRPRRPSIRGLPTKFGPDGRYDRHMRLVCIVVAFSVSTGVFAATPGAAPPKAIASYCSKSGDLCYGAFNRDGLVRLEITTAARYFKRYTLCVRPGTQGAERLWRCGSFPIFRHGSTWSSSVRIDHFPVTGPAVCRVAWKLRKGHPLGPSLLVRVPKP